MDRRWTKIWIAHDIGRALNPLLVEGQVEGSIYMGIGEALMEEQVFRKGLHKIPSLLEYKSPTTLETPEIHTYPGRDRRSRGPVRRQGGGAGAAAAGDPGDRQRGLRRGRRAHRRDADHAREGAARRSSSSARASRRASAPTRCRSFRFKEPLRRRVRLRPAGRRRSPCGRSRITERGHDAAARVHATSRRAPSATRCALLAEHGPRRACWWPAGPTSTRT